MIAGLLIVTMINFVSAGLSLNTGKLYFDLIPGEKNCQKVTVVSSDYAGTLKVRDVWTDNQDVYNTNQYNKTAESMGLTISYPQQINNFNTQQEVEICITGNNPGNYKGALIFTPTSNTNIVVEVGTWLFVNVGGTSASQSTTASTASTATATTAASTETSASQTQTAQTPTQTTTAKDEQQNNNAHLTGAAIGSGDNSLRIAIYFVIGLAVLALMIAGYKIWRKSRWERGL